MLKDLKSAKQKIVITLPTDKLNPEYENIISEELKKQSRSGIAVIGKSKEIMGLSDTWKSLLFKSKDEESLKIFEKKYGTLLFERIFETHNSDDVEWGYEYTNDTILSRYGYTAKENALTKKERQFILSYIIENKIADKSELKSILSTFIKLRGDRCYKAEPIWREDLKFLNEYNSNNNRFIGNSVLIRKNKT